MGENFPEIQKKINMNIGRILEILKPLSRYCHDNKIPQPVYEVDIVRNDKIWICCRSGSCSGTAIGDAYEDVLSKEIENFVANFPYPYRN